MRSYIDKTAHSEDAIYTSVQYRKHLCYAQFCQIRPVFKHRLPGGVVWGGGRGEVLGFVIRCYSFKQLHTKK